jgi:hypothetical protein
MYNVYEKVKNLTTGVELLLNFLVYVHSNMFMYFIFK